MVVGALFYLVGWILIGVPQLLIALGIPLFTLGAFAFYGETVSDVSINSKD